GAGCTARTHSLQCHEAAESQGHLNTTSGCRRSPAVATGRECGWVYAQFLAVSLVFYAIFFGLPLWLEQDRHFGPGTTGLILLPLAAVGVLVTPLAVRLIDRAGPKPCLILGSALLLAGSLALLLVDAVTPIQALGCRRLSMRRPRLHRWARQPACSRPFAS